METCSHEYEWVKYLQEAMVCIHCNRIMRPEEILQIVNAAQQSAQDGDVCPVCDGRGWIPNGEPDDCDACNGTGKRQ